MKPKYAIVAVTLNCNSRCIMCDIWKNRIKDELKPKEYLKLPQSLIDINVTGGEPFLRPDLPEIIANIKQACPGARLVMNSNGFMPHRVKSDLPQIKKVDPKFAFRVSIDGIGKKHDRIRGIPGGFKKILETIKIARTSGIKDLGVSFTAIEENKTEMLKVKKFADENRLQFSVTVATGSAIYFGKDKKNMRPKNVRLLSKQLDTIAKMHYLKLYPKEIVRGWFVNKLSEYVKTGKRALVCDAGKGFFYLDSVGNVYTCHLKPWIMGNIRNKSFKEIFKNNIYSDKVSACNDCFMVCTAKSQMRINAAKISLQTGAKTLKTMISYS